MADHDGTAVPLRVWRRSAQQTAPASAPDKDQVLYCGGPNRTPEDIFLEMRERKRQRDEERERQKAEEAQKGGKQRDDEDDNAAVERFRNDRYAVGLLRQDNTAWGDGPTYAGTLG